MLYHSHEYDFALSHYCHVRFLSELSYLRGNGQHNAASARNYIIPQFDIFRDAVPSKSSGSVESVDFFSRFS
jgi:hypothetical protein